MYAIGWLDKKLKSILCNCGTTFLAESPSIRRRHRKVLRDGVYVTESIDLEIPRPEAIFEFFLAFAKIDIHDHIRQGILEMERFWLCKNWYLRIFQTIFAVTIVNAYLGYRWECITAGTNEDQIINFEDFAGQLAYQMIFNIHLDDTPRIITRSQSPF
jgi:hypothetical protein